MPIHITASFEERHDAPNKKENIYYKKFKKNKYTKMLFKICMCYT